MANFRPILVTDDLGTPSQGANDETALRVDDDGAGTSYIGKARAGTPTDSARWQIKRVSTSGLDSTVEWADGDIRYDNVWDDRAALSYS